VRLSSGTRLGPYEIEGELGPIRGSNEYATLKAEITRRNAAFRAALKGVL